jgi:hypothetical protein
LFAVGRELRRFDHRGNRIVKRQAAAGVDRVNPNLMPPA